MGFKTHRNIETPEFLFEVLFARADEHRNITFSGCLFRDAQVQFEVKKTEEGRRASIYTLPPSHSLQRPSTRPETLQPAHSNAVLSFQDAQKN
jgi:hypothetical protein